MYPGERSQSCFREGTSRNSGYNGAISYLEKATGPPWATATVGWEMTTILWAQGGLVWLHHGG